LFTFIIQAHSVTRAAKVSYSSVVDTIIKLDSVKNNNLIRKGKKKSVRLKDTVNVKGLKTLPDTAKKNKQGVGN
jgi:hypothetical protein